MKKKSLSILLLSFFLVLGYLALNRNILYSLAQRKVVPTCISLQRQEALDRYYEYWATNIFDKGYAKYAGADLNSRLMVYPGNIPLEDGRFVILRNSSRNIIKISVPKGLRHGALRLDINASSGYSIGVSYDLENWKFTNYPGYSERLMNIVSLKKGNLPNELVYLKFVPHGNQSLNVYFNEFQYTIDFPNDIADYSGNLLFYPDIDVDYKGKIINQPGISYEEYKSKKNLQK